MSSTETKQQTFYKTGYYPETPSMHQNSNQFQRQKARIIQFEDPQKTLPDGSKVVYAENDEKITIYKKTPGQKGIAYVYERQSGNIFVNGKSGSIKDQNDMIEIGKYLIDNGKESDMVTITLN